MSDAARTRFIPGVILNGLALLAALCSIPMLVLPVLKVMFAGLLMNALVAGVALIVGALLIDVGPIVGLALAWSGKYRAVTIVLPILSIITLAGLAGSLESLGLNVTSEKGEVSGSQTACKAKTQDASAIGRACKVTDAADFMGDCPPEYFCMDRVVDHPETKECSIPCSKPCECPSGLRCVFSKCVQ